MNHKQEFAALILLKATQGIIRGRRSLEEGCGYPSDYGGDKLLLQRIDEFLADSNIQHEVIDAIAFQKRLMKEADK